MTPVRYNQRPRYHLASFAEVSQNGRPAHLYSYPLVIAGHESFVQHLARWWRLGERHSEERPDDLDPIRGFHLPLEVALEPLDPTREMPLPRLQAAQLLVDDLYIGDKGANDLAIPSTFSSRAPPKPARRPAHRSWSAPSSDSSLSLSTTSR